MELDAGGGRRAAPHHIALRRTVLLAAAFVLAVVALVLPEAQRWAWRDLDVVVGVVLLLAALHRLATDPRGRAPWALLVLTGGLLLAGNAAWDLGPDAAPGGLADGLFGAAYLATTVVLTLLLARRAPSRWREYALDAALIGWVTGTVAWTVLLARSTGAPLLAEELYAVGYVGLGSAQLYLAVRLASRPVGPTATSRAAWWAWAGSWLVAAAALRVVGDAGYVTLVDFSLHRTGGAALDGAFTAAKLALAVALLVPTAPQLTQAVHRDATAEPGRWQAVPLALALLVAPVALVAAPTHDPVERAVLAVAAGAIATLALLRLQLSTARARAADRAVHERHRALFTDSGAATMLVDPDTAAVVDANAAAARLTGRDLAELRTLALGDLGPDARAPAPDGAAITRQVDRPDGTRRCVDLRVTPITLDGRALLQVVLDDATEREQLAGSVREGERWFRFLADNAEDIIYRIRFRPTFATEYLSPSAATTLGLPLAELAAGPVALARHLHEGDGARWLDHDSGVLLLRWHHPDGRVVWLEDHVTPIVEDGVVVGRQGIVRDVSRRQQTEDALRAALASEEAAIANLRRVDQMKDTFLRAVSHELRTPLTVVSGVAHTLADHRVAGREGRLLEALVRNADRLTDLLDDLLDVNRMTSGALRPALETVDLAALVARAAEEVDLAGHRLRVASCDAAVHVDRRLVERLVVNLLANAVRHTPPGTDIEVDVTATGDGTVLRVRDRGPGVPPELRTAVFEPFRQGPQAADAPSPGTGIGLALVDRIAQLHGGRAWVEPRPGGGAVFAVEFPAVAPAVSGPSAPATAAASAP